MFHNKLINATINISIPLYIHQHEPYHNNQFEIKKQGIPINPKHKSKKKKSIQNKNGNDEILLANLKLSTPKRKKSTQ